MFKIIAFPITIRICIRVRIFDQPQIYNRLTQALPNKHSRLIKLFYRILIVINQLKRKLPRNKIQALIRKLLQE